MSGASHREHEIFANLAAHRQSRAAGLMMELGSSHEMLIRKNVIQTVGYYRKRSFRK